MEDNKQVLALAVEAKSSFSRRDFVSAALGASLMSMVPPGVRSGAWAAGSDAPEKKEVRIGFIPLTDCASVVMASVNEVRRKIRHQDHPDQGSLVGFGARQAGQWRTGLPLTCCTA